MIDDVDATIARCRFRLWDYNGTISTPVLGLEVTYREDDDNETTQVYSAGDTKFFVPNEDGSEATPVGKHSSLQDSTNAMAWMVSMVNAGFPEDKITDKVTVFEGTKVHVAAMTLPKRKGIDNKPVPLITKIHAYPWDASQQKAVKAAKAGGTKTTTAGPKVGGAVGQAGQAAATTAVQTASTPGTGGNGESKDYTAKGMETLIGILAEKGGSIPKSQLAQAAFKALASDPDRNQVVPLIYKDEFLKQADAPWTFDGTTVSMG